MANRREQLVVRAREPWKNRLVAALLVAALGAGAWALFAYGYSRAGIDLQVLQKQGRQLEAEIGRLTGENAELREQKAVLERSRDIDQRAYGEVKESLQELQDEILELQEEVAFYRSIVAPNESAKGLRVQTFKLERNGEARGYRYRLILTQVATNNRITRGRVHMTIEGLQADKQRELALKDIATEEDTSLAFRFKYFQSFEGDIVLPQGFIPSRVRLTVESKRAKIEKTYEWPQDDQSAEMHGVAASLPS